MSTTSETLTSSLDELLKKHANVLANPDREEMIRRKAEAHDYEAQEEIQELIELTDDLNLLFEGG